jgi:CheY-like chemotaxis protein
MAKILIVDDDFDFRQLMQLGVQNHAVEGINHQIDSASNGREAISSLQKSVSEGVYNLLLTDYQMGEGPDGVDVIEEAVRLGVGKIFIITGFELNLVNPPQGFLNKRLRTAILTHQEVVFIQKPNFQSFIEKVCGYLELGIRPVSL